MVIIISPLEAEDPTNSVIFSRYQFERSNFLEPEPLLKQAEAICLAFETEKYEQLSIINAARFAMQQWKNNGEAALPFAEKYLHYQRLQRDLTGKETTEFSYGHYAMGVALGMCQIYSKAIPYLTQAKDIRSRLPGFKPADNFSPMYHQALAAFHQGRIDDCEKLLLDALEAREAAVGKNDKSSYRPGNIYFTLSHVAASHGRMDESFDWSVRALRHFFDTIGDSHIFTAHACRKVAEHHVARAGSGGSGEEKEKENKQALELLDQSIRIYRDKPYFKEELAKTYYFKAKVLASNGAKTASEALKWLDLAAELLGEVHAHVVYNAAELSEKEFEGLGVLGFS